MTILSSDHTSSRAVGGSGDDDDDDDDEMVVLARDHDHGPSLRVEPHGSSPTRPRKSGDNGSGARPNASIVVEEAAEEAMRAAMLLLYPFERH